MTYHRRQWFTEHQSDILQLCGKPLKSKTSSASTNAIPVRSCWQMLSANTQILWRTVFQTALSVITFAIQPCEIQYPSSKKTANPPTRAFLQDTCGKQSRKTFFNHTLERNLVRHSWEQFSKCFWNSVFARPLWNALTSYVCRGVSHSTRNQVSCSWRIPKSYFPQNFNVHFLDTKSIFLTFSVNITPSFIFCTIFPSLTQPCSFFFFLVWNMQRCVFTQSNIGAAHVWLVDMCCGIRVSYSLISHFHQTIFSFTWHTCSCTLKKCFHQFDWSPVCVVFQNKCGIF